MKKIITILIATAIFLTISGCGTTKVDLGKQTTIDKSNGYTLVQEVIPFKYSADEDEIDERGTTTGLKVTADNSTGAIKTKSDAISIAKQEVSVEYNKININYDRTRGIWKIIFSLSSETTDSDGNIKDNDTVIESVYVDEDGYTIATLKAK